MPRACFELQGTTASCQRPCSGRHLDFGPALQGNPGQQWGNSALALPEPYQREELARLLIRGGWRRCLQNHRDLKFWWELEDCIVPILKKNCKRKGTQSFPFWSTSCLHDLGSYPLGSSDLYKIKLTLVPLSDRTQLLARKCLENTAEPELKVDSTKFNRVGSLLFPAYFHLDLKDSSVFALGNQLYLSHSWSECCCHSLLAG